MSKIHATVENYMTPAPHAANIADSLHAARDKMVKLGARHLPVMQDSKVVGVLSDRDIQLALGFKHGNIKTMTVEEVYSEDPYTTTSSANLKLVAQEMAEKKIGSAVVVDGEKLVGIFTTTDACRALSESLA